MTTTIPSTDGVEVALHELAGTAGAPHPIVFIAHATGFHGRTYRRMADALAPRFHTFAPDFRAHGDTPAPPGWEVDWRGYGDDALAVARFLGAQPGSDGGLIGFGHSKGGASLLMAARRAPELFRQLVLFEPIVFPAATPDEDRPQSALPAGARRRRAVFPSREAAIEHYGSKPPLQAFDPQVLEDYVRDGFGDDPEGVRLKCAPEHEARTFETGALHDTWDHLGDIATPVLVIAGVVTGHGPAAGAAPIVEQLPNGRLLRRPDLDHFGPMTHPELMAGFVVDAVEALDAAA
jgi:pimeloyl-ACP methyl ester carboxylesterase